MIIGISIFSICFIFFLGKTLYWCYGIKNYLRLGFRCYIPENNTIPSDLLDFYNTEIDDTLGTQTQLLNQPLISNVNIWNSPRLYDDEKLIDKLILQKSMHDVFVFIGLMVIVLIAMIACGILSIWFPLSSTLYILQNYIISSVSLSYAATTYVTPFIVNHFIKNKSNGENTQDVLMAIPLVELNKLK